MVERGEPVVGRRPELSGHGGDVWRIHPPVVPGRAGPHERADAHRDTGPGASVEAAAGSFPHRRRGRPPRRIRRQGAALPAAFFVGDRAPRWREPPVVADRAGRRAPMRRCGAYRRLLPATTWHDPREPRSVPPFLPGTALRPWAVAEERGEGGELATAWPRRLDLESSYVAFLEAGSDAIGRPHLGRPEEEAARVPLPRPRDRGVRLPAGHVRRHGAREELDCRLIRRWRRRRQGGSFVLRGGEREEAVAEAGRAHADPALVRVPLAPHGPIAAISSLPSPFAPRSSLDPVVRVRDQIGRAHV